MIKEAILLAGGLGTRLKGVISDLPKPMAPVNGRPFMQYILEHLSKENFSRVIISTGYKSEHIVNYFGKKYKSIELVYSVEEEPMGTGGAISLALQKTQNENIVVLNGDTFFPVSFNAFYQFHLKGQAEVSIALKKVEEAQRYGTVRLDNCNDLLAFEEKGKSGEGLINAGIYLMDRGKFLERNLTGKYSFEKDYLEQVVNEGVLKGLIFNGYFIDIGIPESYLQAQDDFPRLFTFPST